MVFLLVYNFIKTYTVQHKKQSLR